MDILQSGQLFRSDLFFYTWDFSPGENWGATKSLSSWYVKSKVGWGVGKGMYGRT